MVWVIFTIDPEQDWRLGAGAKGMGGNPTHGRE